MKIKNLFIGFIVVGILSFIAAYAYNPVRAWHGYLLNYYFITSIALGGAFFAATQHLTSAGWSATVRRIPESFIAWLPLAVVLFLPLIYGGHYIYEWMHAEAVKADHLLAMKSKYLNVPFFLIRAVLFFAMWYLVGGKLVSNSLKQDQVGGVELTNQNKKFSAIFLPLFALLFTFFSVDLVMSLDPHWYSTMFGVNCFANLFLSALASFLIVIINMKKKGYFGDSVNDNHIQILGLLMFGFTVFYAYIAFSQFMLIWYGNMPEETQYYLKRWENGWSFVAYLIVFTKFVIPFIALLPRHMKRTPEIVVKWAYWIVIACWIDAFWMVMPNFSKSPFIPVFEFGILLGFIGALGLVVKRFLTTHPVQPQKDPRVQEALHLHQ
ncbi:MAG: hypothetical protein IPM57_06440 [Oligoflexia bacterium]|nr:hypothetical protein [Oligoflexia bacterium]